MKNTRDFSGKTAVIVCHDVMFGPPHELRDYLLRHKIKHLLFIGHVNRSLPNNPVKSSYIEVYDKGKMTKTLALGIHTYPEWYAYIIDSLVTCYWTLRFMKGRVTYFIGLGNLNVVWGILFSLLGLVEKSIYYVIDYSPKRFQNRIMNAIYHYLDYFCAQFSSVTWNYAKGMVKARETQWQRKFPRQIIVPNGITMKKNLPGFIKFGMHEIVYLGTLSAPQGILFVVEAMKMLKERINDIHLTIIGMGALEKTIKTYVSRFHLQRYIYLSGYIADPYKADSLVSQAALGVAMYVPHAGFIAYTEPGKVKRYLSCSVPVIMTAVSPLAKIIEAKKCGINCVYDQKVFVEKVVSFLGNERMQKQYRKNALRFAKKYDWEHLFSKSFQSL